MPYGPTAPICAKPLNATVCDPTERTVNTGAECGSAEDYYFYSPWRRPGSAPVIDSCGIAGGRNPGQVSRRAPFLASPPPTFTLARNPLLSPVPPFVALSFALSSLSLDS
jgi:hypothetical protein